MVIPRAEYEKYVTGFNLAEPATRAMYVRIRGITLPMQTAAAP